MTFLLDCPHCGPRDVYEFRYQGEVTRRPPSKLTQRELSAYVYFRRNQAVLDRDFQLYYQLGAKDIGLTALTHRPSAGEP